ncbi:MAG: dienelactone hydrolase family protein [Jiangellaceae bacterium]
MALADSGAVTVETPDGVTLNGDVAVPDGAIGVVLFAHGSGSSRHSPRNRAVARRLVELGMATLLADLLTEAEERVEATTGHLRFDIGLLAGRLQAATEWIIRNRSTAGRPVGYFGASTGAAAALVAAARPRGQIAAVVSRGGRPDLAHDDLPKVRAPTLLIVGSRDDVVLELNCEALGKLRCTRDLRIVDGATHLFEEPGALDEVARLAGDWFVRHLGGSHGDSTSNTLIDG